MSEKDFVEEKELKFLNKREELLDLPENFFKSVSELTDSFEEGISNLSEEYGVKLETTLCFKRITNQGVKENGN